MIFPSSQTSFIALLTATYVAAQSTSSSSGTSSGTTGAATGSGTATGPPGVSTTYSFTLDATNPTAVPLSSIISTAPSAPTSPLASTPSAGQAPSAIPNAPGLPNVQIVPSSYPALDVSPPIDSPEVKEWIQEVANSGIPIPNITATVAGGCPANPQAVADTNRCWWTCSGCTRANDITTCPTRLTWGMTYDDGPSFYTTQLLDYLDQESLKATFFVVGSRVISFPSILQAEYIKGHQIAVHTWSHPPLTTLSNEAVIAELGWTRKAIKDVLGVTPNMMRPPYGDIDDRVRNISIAMGLTPVIWTRINAGATYDTDDFDLHSGLTTPDHVLQNWDFIKANATAANMSTGWLSLQHDLFQQTVQMATGYLIPDALKNDPPFNIQPVISCLNKPMGDAYIETNDNSSNPPGGPATASPTSSGSAATSLTVNLPPTTVWCTVLAGFFAGVAAILL